MNDADKIRELGKRVAELEKNQKMIFDALNAHADSIRSHRRVVGKKEIYGGVTVEGIRARSFVEHIENHLSEMPGDQKVVCKICGKTIDEIAEEGK